MKMVSPNDLQNAAKDMMLGGREPETLEDWQLCVNFWAANAAVAQVELCKLLAKVFDCPLSEKTVIKIAKYQMKKGETE